MKFDSYKKIIVVDVDETICECPESTSGDPRRYEKAFPIEKNIEKINKLYDEGNYIIYWTARGTLTGIDWNDLTIRQLKSWGAKFHEAKTGKPFYDVIIDDKSLRIEEL